MEEQHYIRVILCLSIVAAVLAVVAGIFIVRYIALRRKNRDGKFVKWAISRIEADNAFLYKVLGKPYDNNRGGDLKDEETVFVLTKRLKLLDKVLVSVISGNASLNGDVKNDLLIVLIGVFLGAMSSFLGIGGGPINLVILFYFFSMETKTASQNSLYVILFSQISNLVTTFATGSVPEFEPVALVLMIAGGIGGGIIGRALSKRMDNSHTDKLLMGLMVVIMGVCVYNMTRFLA